MYEHKHPLNLIDLWSEQLQHEEEEEEEDGLIAKQDFRCLCCRCMEEITWFDRYYYTCCQCNLSFHKFCAHLPETLILGFHEHTLDLVQSHESRTCRICHSKHNQQVLGYRCSQCDDAYHHIYNLDFYVDVNCAMKSKSLMYHPSHPHLLIYLISKQILCECFACGKEHKGIFFQCRLQYCNGFVYHCEECEYNIDVNCAFIPEEITHASHPNHLLSRVRQGETNYKCRICGLYIWKDDFSYSCKNCDNFHLHTRCALLIPETTRLKCDKHPMKLSYFPIENHKSDYFCEICETKLNPEAAFYHCDECMQSMHTACAPSILCYETHMASYCDKRAIYEFANLKFGGTYNNTSIHPHPLSFVQGIATDGRCTKCHETLQYKMIFKCLDCEFAICYECLDV